MSADERARFPGLLALRRGHSPNCSSAGSVVGVALLTGVAAGVVLNAWAWWFLSQVRGGAGGTPGGEGERDPDGGREHDGERQDGADQGSARQDGADQGSARQDGADQGSARRDSPAPGAADAGALRLRREAFGGVLAAPGALLYLDHARADQAAEAGAAPHGAAAPPAPAGALRAPTEVHVTVTERCPARCTGCYLSAGPEVQDPDPPKAALLRDLEALAGMGVFEVAFGGGEAGLREDLFELAERARALGMVPNLTTSGFGVTPARAARAAALFGQVNVSIDGLGPVYQAARGWDGAERGLAALRTLRRAGARVGVNTALTRPLLETPKALEALAIEITESGAQEWQWLRFKPAGRGLEAWAALAPTPEQLDECWPRALSLEQRTGLQLRFDCALVPFLAGAGLSVERMARLGVTGCPGGHSLLTRHGDGSWAPCSFTPSAQGPRPPSAIWAEDPTLDAWRARAAAPPEPCRSCAAREVCRGGCRVVAGALLGDPLAPDPQCPTVRAHAARAASQRQRATP